MKKSFTLLSVCFLFLAIGLSSCKKDLVCFCQGATATQYIVHKNDTKKNAEKECEKIDESNGPFYDCYVAE